jgi:hypothetical protein
LHGDKSPRALPLWIAVMAGHFVFIGTAQADIVYSTATVKTRAKLDGYVCAEPCRLHIELSETTGAPWQMAVDGRSTPPERYAPFVLADATGDAEDTTIITFTAGTHIVSASNGSVTHKATFTVPEPAPPAPSPPPPVVTGTTLSWTAPTTNEDGSPLTDLAGYRIYRDGKKVADIGLVLSWPIPGAGVYNMTSVNADGDESSVPSNSVTVETPSTPPVDVCKTDPLTLTVRSWPGADSGSRSLGYVTNKPITRLELVWPLSVKVTDRRGCTASVVR